MQPANHRISFYVWAILCYILLQLAHLKGAWATHDVITWDVFGFYLYLPSFFIYEDLGSLGFLQEVFFEGYHKPVSAYASALPDGEGYVMKTSMGMAVLYLPFFLLGHGYASVSSPLADGFSAPYQYAVAVGCIIYACVGLWVMRKLLLHYFSDQVVAICLILIVLGTNYLPYAVYKSTMAHSPLFTLYAFLLWLTHCWHERQKKRIALAIGLLIGLIALVRPTDIVCALIPLVWGIYDKESYRKKWELIVKHKGHLGILVLSVFLVGSLQLIYWKSYSGDWLYYSYDEQGFNFLRPMLKKGLISWHKGWLIYTPMMAFAILGFIPLYKKNKPIFWAILAYGLINYYIVFSWKIWAYGGSVGARALVQSYAALMFPLAALVSWLLAQKKYYLKVAVLAIMVFFIDKNMLLTWHATADGGGFVSEHMNRAYYWKLFSTVNIKKDDKQLLDAPHVMKHPERMEARTLYFNGFENPRSKFKVTQTQRRNGMHAMVADTAARRFDFVNTTIDQIDPKSGSWVKVQAQVKYLQNEWDIWRQARMVCGVWREYKWLSYDWVRVQWLTESGVWYPLSYDHPLPEDLLPTDELQIYFELDSNSTKTVFLDNVAIKLYEPK